MGLNGIAILRIHGNILQILAGLMLLPVIVAIYYREWDCVTAFFMVSVPVFAVGTILYDFLKTMIIDLPIYPRILEALFVFKAVKTKWFCEFNV